MNSESKSSLVTVAIISHNMRESLKGCLLALQKQSFKDFEIVLVDDRSEDATEEMVHRLADPRIRFFKNLRRLGLGATRNLTLHKARGHYVFFTDADCVPDPHWLEAGVSIYRTRNCIGVTGQTLPLGHSTRRSDRQMVNLDGRFMACNLTFTREVLEKLGGFDPLFDAGQEDVELGLRAQRYGEIPYVQEMLVYHRIEPYTVSRLFSDARRYKTQVMIFKRYRNDQYHRSHSPPIVHKVFLKPEDWWVILLPVLLLRSPSNQSLRDFLFIPFVFLATLYRRWVIWKTAYRERILLL